MANSLFIKATHRFTKKGKHHISFCPPYYDPEFGDIKGGIPANTAFEDLPADWVCPVCKAPKKQFEKMG